VITMPTVTITAHKSGGKPPPDSERPADDGTGSGPRAYPSANETFPTADDLYPNPDGSGGGGPRSAPIAFMETTAVWGPGVAGLLVARSQSSFGFVGMAKLNERGGVAVPGLGDQMI